MATSTIPSADVTRLVRTIMILTGATVLSIFAAVGALYAAASSKTVAIAVDHRGVVVPVVPLTEAIVSEPRVVGFVEECLRKAFSHDFLHFDQTVPRAQECFTPTSADSFAQALQPFVKLMEEKRMVMAVTVPRPPRVVNVYEAPTVRGPVVHWDVQAQIEIYFEGRNERIPSSRHVVQMTVMRVPLESTPRGILISKFDVGTGAR